MPPAMITSTADQGSLKEATTTKEIQPQDVAGHKVTTVEAAAVAEAAAETDRYQIKPKVFVIDVIGKIAIPRKKTTTSSVTFT